MKAEERGGGDKPPVFRAVCLQKDAEVHVTSIHAVSRADALPFEVIDASRSEAEIAAAAEKGEQMVRVGQPLRLDRR